MSGGRIVFVGTDAGGEGVDRAEDAGPRRLAGKMVLPGFHDAHVHPVSGGVEALECDLNGAPTPAAVLERVKAYAAAHPSAPWIRGGGWELTLFPDGNPSKALLDAIVPDRPVYLSATDGHSVWVNSKALQLAGVTKATPDPPYGRIERDPATGEPTGTLREDAADLVSKFLPKRTAKDYADGLREAPPHREPLRADVARRSERVGGGPRSLPDPRVPRRALGARRRVAPLRHGQGPRGGAATRRPAQEVRRPAPADQRRQDLRRRRPRDAHGRGARALPRAFRATAARRTSSRRRSTRSRRPSTGRASRSTSTRSATARSGMSLDAVEAARRANGARDARHHLAHIELIDPADIPRFRRLGVIANFQPFWANGDKYLTELTEPKLGPERSRWLYPIAERRRLRRGRRLRQRLERLLDEPARRDRGRRHAPPAARRGRARPGFPRSGSRCRTRSRATRSAPRTSTSPRRRPARSRPARPPTSSSSTATSSRSRPRRSTRRRSC